MAPQRARRPVPKRFGHNLSLAIDEVGMTNQEVAIKAGMTETEVSYYRNARREAGVHKASKLAAAVGRTLDELVSTPTPEELAAERIERVLRGAEEHPPPPLQAERRVRSRRATD